MSGKNIVYGVQGVWVMRDGKSAYIANVESVTFTDSTTLVESKNSLGITTNLFTGDRGCSWGFNAQDLSPLAKSIMTGYELTAAEATTAKTAHVQNFAGDWTGAFTVSDDAVPGTYFIQSTAGTAATYLKINALDPSVIVRTEPKATAALAGVTTEFDDISAGDSCILTIQPASIERGTLTIDPKRARKNFSIAAASDPRESGSAKQVQLYYAPEVMLGEMANGFATIATASNDLSGMIVYSDQIGGYYTIQDIVI